MIRLRTLGECVIEVGGRRVGPEAGHVFGLLLFLAIERGRRIGRGTLVEHFWAAATDDKARHCLRQALYKVRLVGAPVESTASHVELDPAAVTGDFLELADRGRIDVGLLRVGGAAFGDFLPGYAPPFSPAFTEWLESKRDFVHGQIRRALSTALVECRSEHRWADVDAVARHCLRIDPLNEEATLALAEATALTGSKAQALSMLDRFVTELGPDAGDIRLPATLLRKRIAERLPTRHYTAASDALFLGRDADLATLGALYRDVRAGRGQACIVWGDPGIGKSRLAAECAKAAGLHGARVATIGCQASDAVRPLSIWVDVVPRLQALPGALGCSPESVAYLRRLTEHDRDAPPNEDAQEAAYLHARVRRALLDLVDAIADEAPLVLVVEDVHWLDPQSWDVLREMIDWAADRRVFFVLTSRTPTPTEQPSPRLPRRLVTHHLGALDAGASASLLDAVVRDHRRALEPEFREWCVGVSEGNPLFLRELASQWVETGDASKVPATLASVIGERLSRLRPTSLRLLQASAILGKNSTFDRLEAVTDYKKFELLDAVEELEAVGLLVAGGAGVQVRHELIARAALQRINEGAKKLLHRNSARVLEAEIEATKSPALVWDYVAHCREAGEQERSVTVITHVGNHLLDVGLPGEATAMYEHAVDRVVTSDPKRINLLHGLANASICAGFWHKRVAALEQIVAIQSAIDSSGCQHTGEELQLLEAQWRSGVPVATVCNRALACVEDSSANTQHRLAAASVAAPCADMSGDMAALQRVHEFVANLSPRNVRDHREMWFCEMIYHSTCGDVEAACAFADQVIDYERAHGSPMMFVRALKNSWIPLIRSGRQAVATQRLQEAYSWSEKYRFAALAMSSADELGCLALERGDVHEASSWYLEGLKWAQNVDDPIFEEGLSYLGARVAVMQNEWMLASRRLPVSYESSLADAHLRRRAAHLTIWSLIFVKTNVAHRYPLLIEKLMQVYEEARSLAGQDFNVYCIWCTLVSSDQKEAAYSTVLEYATTFRNESSPLPDYLVRIIQPQSS